MIRVLIVDDSKAVRLTLRKIFLTDPEFEVVGEVDDGQKALDFLELNKVDLITLDLEMPTMNGLDTLHHIMRRFPTPVLIISSLSADGAEITLKALKMGAIDFIHKPEQYCLLEDNNCCCQIIERAKVAARIKVTKLISFDKSSPKTKDVEVINKLQQIKLLGIGASTGGPSVLYEIFSKINTPIKASIILAIHMPENFTKKFAYSLNNETAIEVKECEGNDLLTENTCYVCKGGYHIKVNSNYKIELLPKNAIEGFCPSIDHLFFSIADVYKDKGMGMILTGMGTDGANGIATIKMAGGITVAQDEMSSIVYGMPHAAILTNKVDKIISANEIHNIIKDCLG